MLDFWVSDLKARARDQVQVHDKTFDQVCLSQKKGKLYCCRLHFRWPSTPSREAMLSDVSYFKASLELRGLYVLRCCIKKIALSFFNTPSPPKQKNLQRSGQLKSDKLTRARAFCLLFYRWPKWETICNQRWLLSRVGRSRQIRYWCTRGGKWDISWCLLKLVCIWFHAFLDTSLPCCKLPYNFILIFCTFVTVHLRLLSWQFVREKVVEMSELEFEAWLNAKFPQPLRPASAPLPKTSGFRH